MGNRNARIKSTMLGLEDHGCFTLMLNLDYGGAMQGAGWYIPGAKKGIEAIEEILHVVGVNTWEEIPGKYIRVKRDAGVVKAIGNMLEERWMNFEYFFKE